MHNIKVLVVDDEADFALNLARILKHRGYHAKAVFDGFQALEEMWEEIVYDVVILDIRMPGMNGLKTLAAMHRTFPGTQVIILTGHADLDTGILAVRHGAFDFLMKPCAPEEIVLKVNEACEVGHIRHKPVLWRRNKVGEIAGPATERLSPNDTTPDAVRAFIRQGLGVPEEVYVTDNQDRLLGRVTRQQLVALAAECQHAPKLT